MAGSRKSMACNIPLADVDVAPCKWCSEYKRSKKGRLKCGQDCKDFISHALKVINDRQSPCFGFRCGMPDAKEDRSGCYCLLPELYCFVLGDKRGKLRCVLSRFVPQPNLPPDYSWKKKRGLL